MKPVFRLGVWVCVATMAAGPVAGASAVDRSAVETMWGALHEPTIATPDGAAWLVTRLRPLDDAVATSLPIRSLAAWDVGVGPADLVATFAPVVERAVPDLAERVDAWIAQLETSVGRGAVRELVEALGSTTSLVLLPAEAGVDGWPAPRPVWVFRDADVGTVRSRVDDIVPWIAGSIAPATRGVYGASVTTRTDGDLDLVTLRLDSLVPGPLPRPTIGFAAGVVLASSTDSGVLEVWAALRSRRHEAPTDAVEVFRVNSAALAEALRAADEPLRDRLERLPGPRAWWRAGWAVVDAFSQLGLVAGRTTVSEDGRLHIELDVAPPSLVREAQPVVAP